MAPPPAWEGNWPELPELAAVHLVSIDAEGRPALDRPADHVAREGKPSQGLSKRFYGSTTGTVVILGCPILEEVTASVRIIEGLADGLALAARFEGPVIAGIGTPARLAKDAAIVAWLAKAPHGVVIHADADEPGQKAARSLRRALQDAGISVRVVLPPEGMGKDSADITYPMCKL
jgi:5S rRNA maturation endonuclease (ribonuclease M5)